MFLAVVATVLLLGGIWVYVVPMLQGYVPATFTQNKVAQVAVVGVFLLLTVWVSVRVMKAFRLKKVVA